MGATLTQYEKLQISQKVHFMQKRRKYTAMYMYLTGYQMRPMPFLHEMYFEIFGASHTVSKSPPTYGNYFFCNGPRCARTRRYCAAIYTVKNCGFRSKLELQFMSSHCMSITLK